MNCRGVREGVAVWEVNRREVEGTGEDEETNKEEDEKRREDWNEMEGSALEGGVLGHSAKKAETENAGAGVSGGREEEGEA